MDPDTKTLEVFELRKGQWLLLATFTGGVAISQPPFDAISFPPDVLWPDGIQADGDGEDTNR
ncbi:MAG: hypothetical protein OXE84_04655 [Rhodobacteraceae bacterium]|nr:hypothetical protein [Paracoccaceae bacterium]